MAQPLYTPEHIDQLGAHEIFVFGSNQPGRHGKGAAKTAMKWGAKYGVGVGLAGRTYGIPTKGSDMRMSLPVPRIGAYVGDFLAAARLHPDKVFLVTEIGTGLAGYSARDMGPLFDSLDFPPNVVLPARFARFVPAYLSSRPRV